MKAERVILYITLLLMLMNAGCAGLESRMPHYFSLSVQERSLNEALDQLRAGNEQHARKLLEKVVDGVPMTGVTDEALFRLALLSLREDGGKGLQHVQALLERLASKYPRSIWTRQSASLLSYLAEVKVLLNRQRELKTVKELNLSLSHENSEMRHENREMRQTLERLKQLDLEQEQRIKR